ncbi:MAG: 2-C-methyl-D-erythritol 2,4-cyclodiphosphate synthase [Kiritimatiellae bacterium]|nr:2-C-methyl-D-erythritol 2,4-cyclodiphosphate synthase [Kiritimatiellia bacterium]
MRIGFGYDSHRFEVCASGSSDPALSQKLGGVFIPGCPKLKGHSDADVLIHAVIDALLGATALGDIGSHFPDTDPCWKDADSAKLLSTVMDEITRTGYAVGNVDVTLICERPKLRPHVDAIRSRLAELLRVPVGSVSVKGKTNEGMDATGEGVGIAVHAVASVESAKG